MMYDNRHNLHYSTGNDDVRARPGTLQDVPIVTNTTSFDIDVPVYSPDIGNSLPTADEIRRMERPGPRRSPTKLIVSVAVAFACLLGIVVGVHRSRGAPPASSVEDGYSTPQRSEQDILEYLLHYKVSSQESLKDPNSPQYMAFQWLVHTDRNPWQVPTAKKTARDGYVFTARYVLAVLYYALDGSQWTHSLNFLSDDDICDWHESILDHKGNWSPEFGVSCETLQIFPTGLDMTNNNLIGSLPTELGELITLRSIDMEQNSLENSIPTEFCNLDQLHRVMLGKNLLSGKIPDCMDNLDGLQQLALNDNVLEGTIPLASNDMLKHLFLDDNAFSDNPLGVVGKLTSLEFLMAQNNDFTGMLTPDLFSNHDTLAWIDLSGNDFESPISSSTAFPVEYLKLPLLEVIDLSSNNLNGPLPAEFPLNERLKFLGLHNNAIDGSIPPSIARLVALHHLDLSENNLTGALDALGDMLSLRALYVGENPSLTATAIPESFQKLYYLQDLSLRESNRIGSLPNFLADLRNLKLIDLGQNDINGTIPVVWGELKALEFLMLNKNPRLTGDLPDSLSQWEEMRAIFMDGTNITGNVEEVICELPNFEIMDGKEIAYGDCFNGNFECHCCECCDPDDATCSSSPFQLNLRESWTKDFAKLHFEYSNDTSFLEHGEINAAAYKKPPQGH